MKRASRSYASLFLVCVIGSTSTKTSSHAQQAGAAPATRAQTSSESLDAINADYLRELTQLEKKRLDRLGKLAESSKGDDSADAYIAFFQTALTSGLYREAEPLAERVLKSGHAQGAVLYLAEVTNILAEIDRGDFEESLDSLAKAVNAGKRDGADQRAVSLVLPRNTRLSLLETYYQKLVQADQFDIARRAFQLIAEKASDPVVKQFGADRLARLNLVGKPAPAVTGTEVDGNAFRLSDLKGDVVLFVFWATWCLPSGPEVEMLDQIQATYSGQGLHIIGVNVDSLQSGVETPDQVAQDVRRFLIEHNIRFPILINGKGDQDYAKHFGVSEIPANFLIDRAGRVFHVDLTPTNIDAVVKRALGK